MKSGRVQRTLTHGSSGYKSFLKTFILQQLESRVSDFKLYYDFSTYILRYKSMKTDHQIKVERVLEIPQDETSSLLLLFHMVTIWLDFKFWWNQQFSLLASELKSYWAIGRILIKPSIYAKLAATYIPQLYGDNIHKSAITKHCCRTIWDHKSL